jgi:hypothetical protein
MDVAPSLDHSGLELIGYPVDIGAKIGGDCDWRKQQKQGDGEAGKSSG